MEKCLQVLLVVLLSKTKYVWSICMYDYLLWVRVVEKFKEAETSYLCGLLLLSGKYEIFPVSSTISELVPLNNLGVNAGPGVKIDVTADILTFQCSTFAFPIVAAQNRNSENKVISGLLILTKFVFSQYDISAPELTLIVYILFRSIEIIFRHLSLVNGRHCIVLCEMLLSVESVNQK